MQIWTGWPTTVQNHPGVAHDALTPSDGSRRSQPNFPRPCGQLYATCWPSSPQSHTRPLTSASARQRPARPGLPCNAIFLSCPCRLLCLSPARRAGEAFAACRSPWPGHAGSRHARLLADPVRRPAIAVTGSAGRPDAATPPAGAVLAAAGHPWGRSRRRGRAAPLTERGGGPPSRPSAGVRRGRACGPREVSGRGRGLRRGWRSWRRGWVLRR